MGWVWEDVHKAIVSQLEVDPHAVGAVDGEEAGEVGHGRVEVLGVDLAVGRAQAHDGVHVKGDAVPVAAVGGKERGNDLV